jgi:ATP-dependent RNA helicase RhlE
MKFSELNLSDPILRAVEAEGYSVATPIQAKAIPLVLAGHDVMGCAQTGTGKTAAFALPLIQKLSNTPRPANNRARVLVLAPTRELAVQIADGFRAYGRNAGIRHFVIFGGVNQRPQVDALKRGLDVIIATPGRLLDLVNQGFVDLRSIDTLVLDEADRMLDMGFITDIRKIAGMCPKERQTLMFSATMAPEIRQLAQALLRNPTRVEVTPVAQTADNIEQSVYFVEKKNKHILLAHLYNELPMARAIVFTRTKHGADKLIRHLHGHGIKAEAIHGNKSQNARQRALDNFKRSKTPVLVATDIAARGIDVDNITHVVNYDLTHEPETYVHRIGRTARAGASGAAVSLVDHEEKSNLRAIEKLLRKQITVKTDHPEYPKGSPPGDRDNADRREHRGERSERPASHDRGDRGPSHPRKPSHGGGHGGGHGPRTARPQHRRDDGPGTAPESMGIDRQRQRPLHPVAAGAARAGNAQKPGRGQGGARKRRRF